MADAPKTTSTSPSSSPASTSTPTTTAGTEGPTGTIPTGKEEGHVPANVAKKRDKDPRDSNPRPEDNIMAEGSTDAVVPPKTPLSPPKDY